MLLPDRDDRELMKIGPAELRGTEDCPADDTDDCGGTDDAGMHWTQRPGQLGVPQLTVGTW